MIAGITFGKPGRYVKSGHITHAGFKEDVRVYLLARALRGTSVVGRRNCSGS